MSDLGIRDSLPVGPIDSRAIGWWAMASTVATEAALFAYLLFCYFYLWIQPHGAGMFPENGPPSFTYAIPSSVIMIVSSASVYWAQRSIRAGASMRAAIGLGIAGIIGFVFVALQYLDWMDKTFTLSSSTYSSIYYVLTGIDMAHVFAGAIGMFALSLWSGLGYFNVRRFGYVPIGALYWHFVVIVWLVIFFSFYIAPRIWGG